MGENFAYLVIATLAVNSYSLERVWRLKPELAARRLFESEFLAAADEDQIANALRNAGYQRGDYINSLMASRLQNLGRFAAAMGYSQIEDVLRDATSDSAVLHKVGGIGPVVIQSFIWLRDTPTIPRTPT
jgi:hypothetical protein